MPTWQIEYMIDPGDGIVSTTTIDAFSMDEALASFRQGYHSVWIIRIVQLVARG